MYVRQKPEDRKSSSMAAPNIYGIERPSAIPSPFNRDDLNCGSKFSRTKRVTLQFVQREDIDPPLDSDFFKINRPVALPFLDMSK